MNFNHLLKELIKANRNLSVDLEELDSMKLGMKNEIEFEIPSSTNYLSFFRQLVLDALSSVNASEADSQDVILALDEALTNVIKHSYNENTGQQKIIVRLALTQLPDQVAHVVIDLADKGSGGKNFSIDREHDKKVYLERLQRGGLGVFLVRQIMDEVEYTIHPDGTNQLRMAKQINCT